MESEFSKLTISSDEEDSHPYSMGGAGGEGPHQDEAGSLQNDDGYYVHNEVNDPEAFYAGGWNGEIEEIERPPSSMGDHSPHVQQVDPLHALSVIRAMMVQFASVQDMPTVPPGFYGHGMPMPPFRPPPIGHWMPFVPPEFAPKPRRDCPIHGGIRLNVDRMMEDRFPFELYNEDSVEDPITPAEIEQLTPRKLTVMQKHLMALLHSHVCLFRENMPGGYQFVNCNMYYCKTTKNLIQHMKDCGNTVNCGFPLCMKSWRLMCHYQQCDTVNCPICKPFAKHRDAFRNGNHE